MQTTPLSQITYAGRLLTLNQEKIQKFSCGGFILGTHYPTAAVPPDAQMLPIHLALMDGRLLDITDNPTLTSKSGMALSSVEEQESVGFKVYMVKQSDGSTLLVAPKDQAEQDAIEAQIASGSPLVLPPGFDDEERYLIRLDTTELD